MYEYKQEEEAGNEQKQTRRIEIPQTHRSFPLKLYQIQEVATKSSEDKTKPRISNNFCNTTNSQQLGPT